MTSSEYNISIKDMEVMGGVKILHNGEVHNFFFPPHTACGVRVTKSRR